MTIIIRVIDLETSGLKPPEAQWLADKSEMDEDTKFTARHYLTKGK